LENNVSVVRTVQEIKQEFDIYFEWDLNEMGSPGAFYVTNLMDEEFFLVSVSLEYPIKHDYHHNNINFDCNSWVHNRSCYKTDRIFFFNIVSQMIIVVSILNLIDKCIYT